MVTYLDKPMGLSGENCGTRYALDDACDVCGTGARLVGHLKCKGLKNIKRDVFETLSGDWLISEKLYNQFLKENLDKINLKNVFDYKTNEPLPFFNLHTELFLPKATSAGGLVIEGQCMHCKRNGYFTKAIIGDLARGIPTKIIPTSLVYKGLDSSKFKGVHILNSWEHMGLSNRVAKGINVIRYARPLLVVSGGIKLFLEKQGNGKLGFEPLTIV